MNIFCIYPESQKGESVGMVRVGLKLALQCVELGCCLHSWSPRGIHAVRIF